MPPTPQQMPKEIIIEPNYVLGDGFYLGEQITDKNKMYGNSYTRTDIANEYKEALQNCLSMMKISMGIFDCVKNDNGQERFPNIKQELMVVITEAERVLKL